MSEKLSETLKNAIEWRNRMTNLLHTTKHPEHVIEHLKILDYLIQCGEIVEKQLPVRPEVSE